MDRRTVSWWKESVPEIRTLFCIFPIKRRSFELFLILCFDPFFSSPELSMAVNIASDYYYYYVGVDSPLDGPVLHGWIHSKTGSQLSIILM